MWADTQRFSATPEEHWLNFAMYKGEEVQKNILFHDIQISQIKFVQH